MTEAGFNRGTGFILATRSSEDRRLALKVAINPRSIESIEEHVSDGLDGINVRALIRMRDGATVTVQESYVSLLTAIAASRLRGATEITRVRGPDTDLDFAFLSPTGE